jgi:prepilin-type N-terminal cleavage/methylation domain-containing protein
MKKGFTLIELLVVIAIIGILSSVVLASLNTARSKGSDAAVKSMLVNMRAQAELAYVTDYDDVCNAGGASSPDTVIQAAITSMGTAGATSIVCSESNTANAQAWALSALLPSGGTNFWCVDSSGASKARTSGLGATVTSC